MTAAALARSAGNVGTSTNAARAALKNTDEFMTSFTALKADQVGPFLKGMDVDDLTKTLKKLSDDDLATVGKTIDQRTINRLASTADGQELLAKMGKTQTKLSKLSQGTMKHLNYLREGFTSTVKNLPAETKKLVDKVGDSLKKGKKLDGDEAAEAAKAVEKVNPGMAKAADDAVESVPAAKDGLKKLGKYAVGGTLLLMLVYNTANPFKAIERGLNDVGEVAQGVKEVADAAATAAKDTAVGGFNFISFITKNAWISGSMSILCLILIFGFLMTSFLGGGKKLRN